MSRGMRRLLLGGAFSLAGCSAAPPPRPMRYVAVEMPNVVSPSPVEGPHRVEVSRTRVLPNIRLPQDAAGFLRDLQKKAGTSVLRNADLKLTTSVCFLICINTDTATADAGM